MQVKVNDFRETWNNNTSVYHYLSLVRIYYNFRALTKD